MNAQYGAQARIGLILPADNVVIEPELNAVAPPGVSFHALRLTAITHDEMRRQATELAGALHEMGADIAAYGCAETSFDAGPTANRSLSAVIAERSGVPVVTATTAMLDAIAACGLRAVSVLTPYTDSSGEMFERTLADQGVTVLRSVHRDFRTEGDDPREWFLTNRQNADRVRELALHAARPDADGLVIAATNFPALPVVDDLERRLGVPVITSNQAILWWCLTRLGLPTAHLALGRLMGLSEPVPS
jgi:maleate isomerase